MGQVCVRYIVLSNPRQADLSPIPVKALAATGALLLCIPEHLALQLGLETASVRAVSVADGQRMNVPYVGPIKVSFGQRFCYVGALVRGGRFFPIIAVIGRDKAAQDGKVSPPSAVAGNAAQR